MRLEPEKRSVLSSRATNCRKRKSDSAGNARRKQGIVLDDFLTVIHDMRRHFKLPNPQIGLKQMEQHIGARAALKKLIQATVDRHRAEIYTNRDPFFSEIGTNVYSKLISTPPYTGWQVSASHVPQVLRKLLEGAFQTLVQLPDRHQESKPNFSPRKLRLLGACPSNAKPAALGTSGCGSRRSKSQYVATQLITRTGS
jgi:hypothetical protein